MPDQANGSFSTFGEMLKHLRRRARLTQKELGIAVGYSEAHVARLENGQRAPDIATVQAVLVQALDLKNEPALAAELVRLAKLARAEKPEPDAAPATAPKCPNNLPVQLSDFIGRAHDIEETLHLLTTTRLLTLTGSGGAGKTRLSIEVGNALVRAATTFPDGVWLVELAPISDTKRVPDAVLSALKLAEAKRDATAELVEYLRDMHMLIILDNCEHLITACAELAEALLRGCPNLRILATSREGLNISGEVTHPVPPMVSSEAMQLFVERARHVRDDFAVNVTNQPAIAEICQHLDGMPLAIELAAARLRVLSVEQIAARLDDRFQLLTGGTRTAPARQQTLRFAIDWSYDMLPPAERKLLQQLSVFAGSCTLEAAEGVYNGVDALDLLDQLANKSLVTAVDTPLGVRFNMLETIRQYAHEKLVEAGEFAATQERHLRYFASLAQRAEPHLMGHERGHWLDVLEAEHDNLRAALGWAAHQEDGQTGAELAVTLSDYWILRGYLHEGFSWMQSLILNRNDVSDSWRVKGIHQAGRLLLNIGDVQAAMPLCTEMLLLAQRLGDEALIHRAISFLARHNRMKPVEETLQILSEQVEWARAHSSPLELIVQLDQLASFLVEQHELDAARAVFSEALSIEHRSGYVAYAAWDLIYLANIEYLRGRHEAARVLLEQSIAYSREANDVVPLADALADIAGVDLHLRDDARASNAVKESVVLHHRLRSAVGVAQDSCTAAGLALLRGKPARAARLLASTAQTYASKRQLHNHFYPEYEHLLSSLHAEMSSEEFNIAWAQGSQMQVKEAIAEVLAM